MTTILARFRGLPSVQVTLAVALLVLGFLIAAQIAAEGPRVRDSTGRARAARSRPRSACRHSRNSLKAVILGLRQHIGELEALDPNAAARSGSSTRTSRRRGCGPDSSPSRARASPSGSRMGTGGSIDGLVSARDVRTLVEELWLAGAEAIAVNGERIVGSTAVIDIGGSMLVNSAYLAPPYTVTAIGPRDLYARLQASVAFVQFVRQRIEPAGIGLSVAELEQADLPAFAGTVGLRFAKPEETP